MTTQNKVIEAITRQQARQIPVYHERFFKLGTNTQRADRKKSEEAITEFYLMTGRKKPEFFWVDSPKAAKDKYGCESPWFMGPMDAYWVAFYTYPKEVLGVSYGEREEKLLNLYNQVLEHCGWWFPFEYAVLCVDRPTEIHMIQRNTSTFNFPIEENGVKLPDEPITVPNMVLHQDMGPAVKYPDGYAVYALNGVRVPEEIAMTPAEKIDPVVLLKETNAEIRREIVRKIGIERVVQKLGAETIDKDDDYELLLLDLKDGRKREYLKMNNPSIGVVHIEGVPPGTKTVAQALEFRNGRSGRPWQLT